MSCQPITLSVVADDAFYAETRDAALVECLKAGRITNASVLMNGRVARDLVASDGHNSCLRNFCSASGLLPGIFRSLFV